MEGGEKEGEKERERERERERENMRELALAFRERISASSIHCFSNPQF
jgi:hypothetical protein